MMDKEILDCHCHSNFSFDSEECVEDYLFLTNGKVVTTEHLDFDNPITGTDSIPDYSKYTETWDRLNKKYDNRLLKGIEVGYTKKSQDRIKRYFEDKTFDIILLSVHQNGTYDFMEEIVKTMNPETVVKEYLSLLANATEAFPEATSMSHIDYGMRQFKIDEKKLSLFDDLFERILKNIIQTNTAVELNTRSMYQFHNLHIYQHVILLYKKLGGNKYTIGSDAHQKAYYRYHFDDAISFLNKLK